MSRSVEREDVRDAVLAAVGFDRVLQDEGVTLCAPLRRRGHGEGDRLSLRLKGRGEVGVELRRGPPGERASEEGEYKHARGEELHGQSDADVGLSGGFLGCGHASSVLQGSALAASRLPELIVPSAYNSFVRRASSLL